MPVLVMHIGCVRMSVLQPVMLMDMRMRLGERLRSAPASLLYPQESPPLVPGDAKEEVAPAPLLAR